ncbi:MAG: hypothetical protein AAF604_07395 [Acidobacteriota bacterium]
MRERLREGHEELLRKLDESPLDLPEQILPPETVTALEAGEVAARQGTWNDFLSILRRFDRAETQAQVLEALLAESHGFAGRSILFLVRESQASAWGGSGWEGDVSSLSFDYGEDKPWAELARGAGVVRLDAGACAAVSSRLEAPVAQEGVLVPLVLRDRIAAALYADRRDGEPTFSVPGLQSLTYLAAQAIETLTFRDRSMTPTLWDGEEAPEELAVLPLWDSSPTAESEPAEAAVSDASAAESHATVAQVAPPPVVEPVETPEPEVDEPVVEAIELPEEVVEEEAEVAAEVVETVAEVEEIVAEVEPAPLVIEEVAEEPTPEVVAAPAEEPEEMPSLELVEPPAAVAEPEEMTEPEVEFVTPEPPEFVAPPEPPAVVAEPEAPAVEPPAAEKASEEGSSSGLEDLEEMELADADSSFWSMPEDIAAEADKAQVPEIVEDPEPEPEKPPLTSTQELGEVSLEMAAAPPEEPVEPPVAEGPAHTFEIPSPSPMPEPSGDETVMIDRSRFPAAFGDPPAPPAPPVVEPPGEEMDGTVSGRAQVQPPSDLEGPGWAFANTEEKAEASADDAEHEEARRLARLLVSEIRLYNEEQVEEGRRTKDIYRRLRDDIDRSRQMYEERVSSGIVASTDYFQQELVRILGAGDAAALGM